MVVNNLNKEVAPHLDSQNSRKSSSNPAYFHEVQTDLLIWDLHIRWNIAHICDYLCALA